MTEPRQQGHLWRPIADLSSSDGALRLPELEALLAVWNKRRTEMAQSAAFQEFQARMIRSWSIETGILERLYSVSEAITMTLLEQGFDAALVPHGESDVPAPKLIAILRDHQEVAEGLFAFVKGQRPLGTSYIKELHQTLTRHQPTCTALDSQGNLVEVPLRRGDWKVLPNNPGDIQTKMIWHEYCPPEHTAAEMDRLVALHGQHDDVSYAVSAAWLHHRFTQIHPFQDGNGRVARALASLVCIRAGGFPLVVHRLHKVDYIHALEQADQGDLGPLVSLFEKQQRDAFLQAIGLSQQVIEQLKNLDAIVADARRRLDEALVHRVDAVRNRTSALMDIATARCRELAATLNQALGPQVHADVFISSEESAHWFKGQIAATAKDLGYFANLAGPRSWVHLRLRHQGVSSLVTSIHHVGRTEDGVMTAVAFLSRREDPGDDRGASAAAGHFETKTVCQGPFTFTAGRDPQELQLAFASWLEQVLTIGIDQWRSSI